MHVVIGGGPAGFFAAIAARRADPVTPVLLLEQGARVLRKVRVSGGGRCNVTHACFDPRDLVAHYPRGGRELRGPFHHFGPDETVAWFNAEGVDLKAEADGRMFPVTNDSATVVDALVGAARRAGVRVLTNSAVAALERRGDVFRLEIVGASPVTAARVILATGGKTSTGAGSGGHDLARMLGHTIVEAVPALFTFVCSSPLLDGLAGVAGDVRLDAAGIISAGPMLITHTGVSGPAVLRLSSWGARAFHACGYRFALRVDWLPALADIDALLLERIRGHGKRRVGGDPPASLPVRLWSALVRASGVGADQRWSDLDREARRRLGRGVKATELPISGQSPFKEEFVSCGGVALDEVDLRTMASRVCPGLHLAGEVLDIDGLTGGFNFQNCWTTGWLAGQGMADG